MHVVALEMDFGVYLNQSMSSGEKLSKIDCELIKRGSLGESSGVARILILEGPEPTKSFHNRQHS